MQAAVLDVAREFLAAINRQDVDALVSLMTPDHVFIDSLGHSARGAESMREGWTLYFQMVPDYRLDIDEEFERDDVVVLLGTACGTYAHAFDDVQAMGLPRQMTDGSSKDPVRWQTPAALRARIQDGKVAEWRVYADNEPLRRIMKQFS